MPDATKRDRGELALIQRAIACLNRNEPGKAEELISRALATKQDAAALQLMGAVRRMQGRDAEAEDYFRRAIALDSSLPEVHHNLGNLLMDQRRFNEAVVEQREAVRLKSNFAQAHLGLALALSAAGDHESAAASCAQALRVQPNYLSAKITLAVEFNELNRPKEAEGLLRRLLAVGTSDARTAATIEQNLGVSLKQQNRLEEALSFFDAARRRAPGIPAIEYNRGDTLHRLGRLHEALESFRSAIEFMPDDADALAQAALVASRLENYVDARAYGASALRLDPQNGIALVALAISDMGTGNFAAAEARLWRVFDGVAPSSENQTSFALGFAAEMLDRHGRTSLAFAVHAASNERRRQRAAPTYETTRAISDVRRLMNYFENAPRWIATPAESAPGAAAVDSHVFLLGFMRSGTTLLISALATSTHVVASDEREYLTGPAGAFLLSDTGLARLEAADDRELARWRKDYWSAVRSGGLDVAGKVFVDKMPFNSLRLPLIARLFPDAKVLFALRDPRDVVLSCFRRRFDMTPYSYEFLRLEDCARFYASVMALVELYRDKLPLDLGEFHYEDIVTDYKPSLQRICEFTGIEWQDSMVDFAAAAGAINQRGASLSQVRRGLYGDGIGQWRRYRDQLGPALDILQPWIDRFGYTSR